MWLLCVVDLDTLVETIQKQDSFPGFTSLKKISNTCAQQLDFEITSRVNKKVTAFNSRVTTVMI